MNPFQRKIVVVDDDLNFSSLVKFELESHGYIDITVHNDPKKFLSSIVQSPFLVILDYQFDHTSGLEVLREIKTIHPDTHVIMLSAQNRIADAVETLKTGAFDYIEKNQIAFPLLLDSIKRVEEIEEELDQTIRKDGRKGWMSFLL